MIKRNDCECCIHYAVCSGKITYKGILGRIRESLSDSNTAGVKINVDCQYFMQDERVKKIKEIEKKNVD